jgi:hypothetical protein
MSRSRAGGVVVRALSLGAVAVLAAALARPVTAHGGTLGGAARETATVPTWLLVATGGAVVGASFLLASFATDREFVASIHAGSRSIPVPGRRVLVWAARAVGLAALAAVLVVGFTGPTDPLSNTAVLVVWAGWWAGFSMTTYLVGNAWPVLNPWRTLATVIPPVGRTYVWRGGAWASVVGLLALVWLEVVSPLADEPGTLATTVLAYSLVTLGGCVVYGTGAWFRSVDPVARVFRYYGAVAPVGTDDDGSLALRVPGAGLTDDILGGVDEVAFVVALLWVTTFDGLVATPAWEALATTVVGWGLPPEVLYPAALVAGFGLFFGIYLLAARAARGTADTFVAAPTLARRFAPSLLAIAAGYHVAHFLGYFVRLIPALSLSITAPFETVAPDVIVLPDWFGLIGIFGVLGGHVLAIAAAHAVAFDLFPGRLQAIRSQYPFIVAMVFYTMVSLWVVTRPDVQPPYI